MDNGNGGPGNRVAQNFEQSMSEAPDFNPNILPTPDQKENDPGSASENVGNNPNAATSMYLDPSLLGAATVNAMQNGNDSAALGEVVHEGNVGMKALTEDQIIGTDVNIAKFQKNGVSKEQESRLDKLKKEPNLYRQQVEFIKATKEALATSFADRQYLMGGKK